MKTTIHNALLSCHGEGAAETLETGTLCKRRKRLDTLEKEIAADEEEIQRLTEFMAGEEAASDYEKLTEAANRMEELQQGLTAKYEEWSELSE